MNYDDLTEEQFNDIAEELCTVWKTLDNLHGWLEEHGRAENAMLGVRVRQHCIAKLLGQDPDKEPQWPPVRKYKVGLTQRRVIEFIAEIEVEATDEYEAEQLAFEQAREDADQWESSLDWEEAGEADEPRELDEDTWQCTAA